MQLRVDHGQFGNRARYRPSRENRGWRLRVRDLDDAVNQFKLLRLHLVRRE